MKGRYRPGERILDSGCGSGRNMEWFLHNSYDITGIDQSGKAISAARARASKIGRDDVVFMQCPVEKTPLDDAAFDHVISSAVLHFARDHGHFDAMMAEIIRLVKPGGTLWIRMASDVGIRHLIEMTESGVCQIPDGSGRYLLTRNKLKAILNNNPVRLVEPFKNVNVDDVRVMCVLVLEKNAE